MIIYNRVVVAQALANIKLEGLHLSRSVLTLIEESLSGKHPITTEELLDNLRDL